MRMVGRCEDVAPGPGPAGHAADAGTRLFVLGLAVLGAIQVKLHQGQPRLAKILITGGRQFKPCFG